MKGMCWQGLLKDQLEIVKVKVNGKIKYAIQPLEEQLSFDKVGASHKWCLATTFRSTQSEGTTHCV